MLDEVLKWMKGILVAMVIAILIEKFIFGITIVQGESMDPTLKNNDKLLIDKIIYQIRKPQLGDIVIFNPPIHEREEELFIKRIIGVEGDQFYIKEGQLYINGKKIKESYIKESYIKDEVNEERIYNIVEGQVPKGMVFVMGDNRNDSNDSRFFGFVPMKNIKGKANFRMWPLDDIKTFTVEYNQ